MPTQQDYTSKFQPTWCPGCGNYSIFPATKMALVQLGLEPHRVAMVFGIGCSSNGSNCYNLYAFHSIHGRSLPVAVGVKLANHELTVIADSGDGDAFGEGMSHFVHTARGNIDITYLVHDNHLYSLTTGQASPTSPRGMKTKTTLGGTIEQPFNPIASALINGATFVAQGFSGDIPHLANLIKMAIEHKGFAFINILQLCPTFNKINTLPWYQERIYKLDEKEHDTGDFKKALDTATQLGEKIPIGVFYQFVKPTYESQLKQISQLPLVKQPISEITIAESLKSYC